MILDIIILILVIGGLIIATYTDLKKRYVPPQLTYGLMASGIILNLFKDIMMETAYQGINSLMLGAFYLVIGVILYYKGFWGGGDAKLLGALGTLLVTNPPFYKSLLYLGKYEFMPIFIMVSFIIGMFYRSFWLNILKNDDIPYVPVFLISFIVLYLQTFI